MKIFNAAILLVVCILAAPSNRGLRRRRDGMFVYNLFEFFSIKVPFQVSSSKRGPSII